MLGNAPFNFDLTRKYMMLFGTLFNDITIERVSANGKIQSIDVPIQYAAKEKMLTMLQDNPDSNRKFAALLPRITFDCDGRQYDEDRKLNSTHRFVYQTDDKKKITYQFVPVPYNLGMKLYVYAKNVEDGNKIVDQIIPFFTPAVTPRAHLIPEMHIDMDIPVVLNDVVDMKQFEGKGIEKEFYLWELHFTLKGYYFGPVKKTAIIKFANVAFRIPQGVDDGQLRTAVGNTPMSEYVYVRPGLTANGEPTSNVSLTVPLDQIEATDDFGYIVKIGDDEDGQ